MGGNFNKKYSYYNMLKIACIKKMERCYLKLAPFWS
jgi:hypothetical protein